MTIDKGSYAYIPYRSFGVGESASNEPEPPVGSQYAFISAWFTVGLMQHYRATGSKEALELAGKFLTHMKDRSGSYQPDGSWSGFVHFHCHTMGILAMLEYAQATGDEELARFCVRSYEYGKSKGESLVGFFPEFYEDPDYPSVEICEVADIISIGLKMSAYGVHDCWEDVDRWIRNMFAEGQMTTTEWVGKYAQRFTETTHATYNESTEDVAERSVGSFGGWLTGNDFWEGRMGPFMHCCTGNATRTLYHIWEHILHEDAERVKVNLLMNRTAHSLDVHSYIPYEGKVELKMKQSKNVSLRIPEWVGKEHVECRVDGQPREFRWDGRYIELATVDGGQTVTVEFPIETREVNSKMGGTEFQLTLRGNEVVDIKPEGTISPLYQRDYYMRGPVRYKKVTRFLAKDTIEW